MRRKKLLETRRQNEIIIPEWLFEEELAPIKKKMENVYNPKTLKQTAIENITLNH